MCKTIIMQGYTEASIHLSLRHASSALRWTSHAWAQWSLAAVFSRSCLRVSTLAQPWATRQSSSELRKQQLTLIKENWICCIDLLISPSCLQYQYRMPSCVSLLYCNTMKWCEIHPPNDVIFSMQHLVQSGSFITKPLLFETRSPHKCILGVQRGVEFLPFLC